MSGIVVITTKGEARRNFVNVLHEETDNAVALVVLQNVRRLNLTKRIISLYKKVGFFGMFFELYHFLAVKLSSQKKYALALLSYRSVISNVQVEYLTETLETNDINEDTIYEHIKKINPDIIVIWGGYILKPRLLEIARHAINMHFGVVPYYRGVNGVQLAILNDDFDHIGITIHHAVSEVDAGEVIKIIDTSYRKSPENFFITLNDMATREYINVIKTILKEGSIASRRQDLSKGKNYLSKEWTYREQNMLAKKILAWKKPYKKLQK